MAEPTVADPAQKCDVELARRDAPVTALGGVAALVAVIGLVSAETTANRGWLGPLLAQLDVGIGMGFVIVGYLVHRRFAAAVAQGAAMPSLRRHGRRWLLRIVPAYWVVVVATHLFAPMASDVRPTPAFSPVASGSTDVPLGLLARAVTFTSPYAADATVRPDAWLWPVAAVAAFCLVVPVAFTLVQRHAPGAEGARRRQVAFVASLVALGVAFRLGALVVDPADPRYLSWLPAQIGFFAIGMALAALRAHPAGPGVGDRGSAPLTVANRRGAWLGGALVALGVLAVAAYGLDLSRTTPWVGGGRGLVRHGAHLLAAAAVCVPIVVGAGRHPVGERAAGGRSPVLGVRPLVALGTVGYGLYLWSGPVLTRWVGAPGSTGTEGFATRRGDQRFDLSLWPGLAWTLGWATAVAAISWFLVEKPWLRFRDRPIGRFVGGLWAIAVVSFATRIWSAGTVMDRNPGNGDPFFYHAQANMIADGIGFGEPIQWLTDGRFVPSAIHPPLFTLWLTPASLVGARDFVSHKTLAAVAGVGVVVVAALLARRLAGERAGLVAAVLVALYPNLWIIDGTLWPEGLYTLVVGLTLLAAYRWRDVPTYGRAAMVGAGVGAAILTRGEALLLLVLLCVPLAWSARRRVTPWFAHAAVMGVVAVGLLAPWTVRNLVQFERPVPVSTNSDEVLYYANCPDTYEGVFIGYWSFNCQERAREARVAEGRPPDPPGDEAERAAAWGELGRQYARENLDRLPAVLVARVTRVWDLQHAENNSQALVLEGRPLEWNQAGLWVYRALLIPGLVGLWVLRRRTRGDAWPLVAMVAMITVTSLYAYGHVRFRTVGDLVLIVSTAVAVDALARRWWPVGGQPSPSEGNAPVHDAGPSRTGAP